MKALITLTFQVEVSDDSIYEAAGLDPSNEDDAEELEDFDLVDGMKSYIEVDVVGFLESHFTDNAIERLEVEERR